MSDTYISTRKRVCMCVCVCVFCQHKVSSTPTDHTQPSRSRSHVFRLGHTRVQTEQAPKLSTCALHFNWPRARNARQFPRRQYLVSGDLSDDRSQVVSRPNILRSQSIPRLLVHFTDSSLLAAQQTLISLALHGGI